MWTAEVRVFWSTAGAIVATVPAERLVRIRRHHDLDRLALLDLAELRLVDVDVDFELRRNQRHDRAGRSDQRAGADLAIEDDAVDRRDDLRLAHAELRLRERRLGLVHTRLRGRAGPGRCTGSAALSSCAAADATTCCCCSMSYAV